jgi:hypothetical protein
VAFLNMSHSLSTKCTFYFAVWSENIEARDCSRYVAMSTTTTSKPAVIIVIAVTNLKGEIFLRER